MLNIAFILGWCHQICSSKEIHFFFIWKLRGHIFHHKFAELAKLCLYVSYLKFVNCWSKTKYAEIRRETPPKIRRNMPENAKMRYNAETCKINNRDRIIFQSGEKKHAVDCGQKHMRKLGGECTDAGTCGKLRENADRINSPPPLNYVACDWQRLVTGVLSASWKMYR